MTVVVVGAAGDAGGRVVRGLVEQGVAARALVRRTVAAEALRDEGFDVAVADLADPRSLDDALSGASRLFLVSSPGRDQVALETNAIDAGERAGVEQIVKISNLDVAGITTGLHGNHRAIEARLEVSVVPSVVLQPSFFATVLFRQAALLARGRFVLPVGAGRIAWIDARDIADVAVVVLTSDPRERATLRLTGPEALSGADLAARMSVVLGWEIVHLDPARASWRDTVVEGGLEPWLADSTVHLYEAVEGGALADVSPDVQRMLGRPPRPIDDFLRDELSLIVRPPARGEN